MLGRERRFGRLLHRARQGQALLGDAAPLELADRALEHEGAGITHPVDAVAHAHDALAAIERGRDP